MVLRVCVDGEDSHSDEQIRACANGIRIQTLAGDIVTKSPDHVATAICRVRSKSSACASMMKTATAMSIYMHALTE